MDKTESTAERMKIMVILREDLETWQKVNVASFVISGIASQTGATGEPYRDDSGEAYLPMIKDPVMAFSADTEKLHLLREKLTSRDMPFAIFTDEIFNTFNDKDNRAAVAAVKTPDLSLAGLAFRAKRNMADKLTKGLSLLR
ncbi:DUF2000 family protein [Pectobacterium actinidiae]|uniref:DUF2000 family protein n=1 Tax=Pectobacterium actinidiae TaxID=1507808 RepID=UPI0040409843